MCPGEARVLRQFIVLLGAPLGISVDATLASHAGYLAGLPPTARAGFRLGLWLIEQGARLSFVSWRRFSALDARDAGGAHAAMAHHRVPVFGQLIEAIHLTLFFSIAEQPEIDRALALSRRDVIAKKRAAVEAAS